MLAFEFFVQREVTENIADNHQPALAAWRYGYEGIDWLEDLVQNGIIENLGGNGYPTKFRAKARHIIPRLKSGLPPQHLHPEYFQSERYLPPSWNGKLVINQLELDKCYDDDFLTIEAWDQS